MSFLRFLGLAATVVAVYFAGYIFHHRNLNEFFPPWVLERLPWLYLFARWLPEDLLTLAWWLSIFASIGAGLLTITWRGEVSLAQPNLFALSPPISPMRRSVGLFCVVSALVSALFLMSQAALAGNEAWWVQSTWAAAPFIFLLGCTFIDLSADEIVRLNKLEATILPAIPERSFGYLLLLLLAVSLLFGWPLAETMVEIEENVVQVGLAALNLLKEQEIHFFPRSPEAWIWLNGATGMDENLHVLRLLPFAAAPTALLIRWSGDPWLATRLIGLFSGLLTVLATWLIGCELFRRTPVLNEYDEVIEDEGQWVALLASALVAVSVVTIHFARLPIYLEPVAWGSCALWAWLRGVRRRDRLALGLGGVLTGLTLLYYPSGLLFALLIPIWWLGVWLLQPNWLRSRRTGEQRVNPFTLLLLWVAGMLIMASPLVGLWVRWPGLLIERFQGAIISNLWRTLTIFHLDAYGDTLFGYPGNGLSGLVAPIAILAIGCLLLNLDSLVGWTIFSWILGALIYASALSDQAPFWPDLLPILPALALAVAFTLDRVRISILESIGSWARQATTYLVISLVVWAGQASWVEHQQYTAQAVGESAVQVGRAVRDLPAGRTPVLVQGEQVDRVTWDMSAIRFLGGQDGVGEGALAPLTITLGQEPASLPPRSTLLLPPGNDQALHQLMARYPDGQLTIQRDGLANPILYLYELP